MAEGKGIKKIVCVLYPDPVDGFPKDYPKAPGTLPHISNYPGQDGAYDAKLTAPTPKDCLPFQCGELLGCVSGKLGLQKFCDDNGIELVVTSDKDGSGCEFEKHLPDAQIVISQPFWPAYMTAERMAMAPNLKMCITAGIGSDHVDLDAAMARNVSVTEVTYSNSISVAEHVVMQMLSLVRNYIPSYKVICEKGWNIADCVRRSYDIEGMHVGTVAAGRIGLAVLRRLKPFHVNLHYMDRHKLPKEIEDELNLTYHETVESLVAACDCVTINCPLHSETEHLFNDELIGKMKKGAFLVNTARGKICDKDAVKRALESGQLAGYAGDVWFPQPPPTDHCWRTMPNHGMTPHISGTSLSAQFRYTAGVHEMLQDFYAGRALRDEYLIVHNGALAGRGAHSYSGGNATKGSEEAVGKTA